MDLLSTVDPSVLLGGIGIWVLLLSLVIGVTFAAARLTASATQRSHLWTVCFVVLVVALPGAWLAPKPECFRVQLRLAPIRSVVASQARRSDAHRVVPDAAVGRIVSVPGTAAHDLAPVRRSLWPLALFALLPAVSLALIGSILRSWREMSRLSRRAGLAGRAIRAAVAQAARRMRHDGRVVVKLTDDLPVPATFGFFRPVLLLPRTSASRFSSSSMGGILAHELAHIHRRDYLRNLLAQVAGALFWFVPAVWLARRELRRDIELSCDDAAILQTGDPVAYADALGELALMSRAAFPSCGLGFSDSRPIILLRIRSALFTAHRCRRAGWPARLAVAFSGALCLALFAFASVGPREGDRREALGAGPDSVRTIHFPSDRSIGSIYQTGSAGGPARLRIGDARGEVPVHQREQILLATRPEFVEYVLSMPHEELRAIDGISLSGNLPDAMILSRLAEMRTLRELDLSNTGIGDSDLRPLRRMTWLRRLKLDRTNVTELGLEQLRGDLPSCDISLPGHSIEILLSREGASAAAWPRRWTAFGAFDTNDRVPDSAMLCRVPRSLRIGKRTVSGVQVEAGQHNWIDFEPVFGERHEGKTAWIFGEFHCPDERVVKIWSAADWWMDWYVDGLPVYNSLLSGNASTDYAYPNHSFRVRFSKGRHVIAVRVLSGSRGWGIASTAVKARRQF